MVSLAGALDMGGRAALKRWHVLLSAGLIGVASLLLVPFEALVPTSMPHLVFRALAIVQPAIFTALAVLVGELTARRIGLYSPLVEAWVSGADWRPVIRRQLVPAMVVGIAVALVLLTYGMTIGRNLIEGAGAQARLASFELPLVTKLLYGGITEELLTRWALLSLFAWIGWRMSGQPAQVPPFAMAVAVVGAAVLFGAGHLPLLFLIAPDASPFTIFAVLAANAVPGILFGILYVRRGLEAAMIAHMLAHLLSSLVTQACGGWIRPDSLAVLPFGR